MRYLTARKRAEGKGSAHHGAEHHWSMQVSAVGLALLVPAFVFVICRARGASHAEVAATFQSPFVVIVVGLTLFIGLSHARKGAQIMIEDYTKGTTRKGLIIFVTALTYLMTATALFALAKLAL